jgi:hypothetical protein
MYNGSYIMTDTDSHEDISDIQWAIISYAADFSGELGILEELDLEDPDVAFYKNYAPTLTDDNKLKPSPMYLNDTNYVPIIIGYTGTFLNMENYYMHPILL